MEDRRKSVVGAVLAVVVLSGCAAPLAERIRPGVDAAHHAVDLGICHSADVLRFTAAGIGNVVDQSTKGIVHLVVYGRDAGADRDGAVILAIAGGVLGAGAGLAKTLEDWRPGVDGCLRDRAAPAPEQEHGYASS